MILHCSRHQTEKPYPYHILRHLTVHADFDLKEQLNTSGLEYILNLLGGKDTDGRWIAEKLYSDTYDRLVEGAESESGIADNVYGFMYFTPVVIQYDVYEEVEIPVGDFQPGLDVPASAKAGEEYPVTDTTVFGDENEFACSELFLQCRWR